MKRCLIIALASLSFTVSAENQAIDCNNAMNTLEINHCAAVKLDLAQAELDKYLKTSLEHNASDPELVQAIMIAQKDWQAYMSSHCDSVYTQCARGLFAG